MGIRFPADTVQYGHVLMLGQCGLRCMAPVDRAGRLAGTEHPPYGLDAEPSTIRGLAAGGGGGGVSGLKR